VAVVVTLLAVLVLDFGPRPRGDRAALRWLALSKGVLLGGIPAGVRSRSLIWGTGHTGISPCRGKTALRVATIARSTGLPGS
jgi:hypothetical protein